MIEAQGIAKQIEGDWIVLAADGRHVTIGRHTDPTEDDIQEAAKGLAALGLAGWLAIAQGNRHSKRGKVTVTMVRPLGDAATGFDEAVARFEAIRKAR